MSKFLKKSIAILCITIILGVLYLFVFSTGDDESSEETVMTGSEIELRTEKILADTQRIDEYTLDISIFDDVRFKVLKDYSVKIEDVFTGRTNPFAPADLH
jgi:hypothetical protein